MLGRGGYLQGGLFHFPPLHRRTLGLDSNGTPVENWTVAGGGEESRDKGFCHLGTKPAIQEASSAYHHGETSPQNSGTMC